MEIRDRNLALSSTTKMTAFACVWCLFHDFNELISVCPCFAETKKAKKKEKVKLPQSKFILLNDNSEP